ncbi:MAG: penicillin-binding protein 2 [Planctomycetota bacterium]|nr:penicillin-binding protein 2 [Planctomycetota bacterium]MDA1212919.1 penicillin-binding protein 2 [Planctomycetota bacterium]
MNRTPVDEPLTASVRSRFLASGLVLVWLVLAGRLVQLQWWEQASLARRGEDQWSFLDEVVPRPGDIVDRQGRVLATSVRVQSVYVIPQKIADREAIARDLGSALQIEPDALLKRFADHSDKHFMWVKRRVNDDEAQRVRQLKLPAGSWGFRDEYLRRYPQKSLAAHVIGLRDIDGIGRGGLEESCDALLRGQPGRRSLIRDAHGRVIEVREEIEEVPQAGRNVVSTLDTVVQLFAEQALDRLMEEWKPKSCCAVVMDPQTFEIWGMASRPAFDLNRTDQVPDDAWNNGALTVIYEPGSTFKPLMVAWGLQIGAIRQDEMFDCEMGEYKMGGRTLHDHHRYGLLSLTDVLVNSSNIGMAKIGERLTNVELHRACAAFGMGRPTGVQLPGELPGLLRPLKDWTSYSTGSIPMGQELGTTPMQMIAAHSALANGGMLMTPQLVKADVKSTVRWTGDSNESSLREIQISSHVVDESIARWVIEEPMFETVQRGTGRRAKMSDYTVFGKTGTAQKFDFKTGKYSNEKHVSSFICGAPVSRPQLLVLVVVDEPSVGKDHYGGVIAAPAASEILHRSLVYRHVPVEEVPLRSANSEVDLGVEL